ncbi:MAG TPA: hypothetical protein VNW06_02440 [Cytophagaceae bacterium]|jgi:hypothetical protein|nr:hypothetical protein [Cytophagaceae bacterium]
MKTTVEKYKKSNALKELESLHFEEKKLKYPNLKEGYLVATKFRDDTSNDLTAAIITYLKLKGCFAARINCQGTYSQKLKKYIYSGSTKGLGDISAIISGGRHLSVEIKIGKDKMSDRQEIVKMQVEASGGLFFIAKDFESFYNWFNQQFNK